MLELSRRARVYTFSQITRLYSSIVVYSQVVKR